MAQWSCETSSWYNRGTLVPSQSVINPISLSASQTSFQDLNCHTTSCLEVCSSCLLLTRWSPNSFTKGTNYSALCSSFSTSALEGQGDPIPTLWPTISPLKMLMLYSLVRMLSFPPFGILPFPFSTQPGFSLSHSLPSYLNVFNSFNSCLKSWLCVFPAPRIFPWLLGATSLYYYVMPWACFYHGIILSLDGLHCSA